MGKNVGAMRSFSLGALETGLAKDMDGLSVNLIAKRADKPQLAAIVCCRCVCEFVVWDTNLPVEIGL